MPDLSSDMRDAVIDQSRKSMHRHFKRKFDRPVACKKCKKLSVVAQVTIGYQCHFCNKYQNAEEAHQRFLNGDYVEEKDSRAKGGFPAIRSSEKREYSHLRDEFEIRADLYANGKTRETMGVEKFNRTLKKELVKNKCYRGPDKTGV